MSAIRLAQPTRSLSPARPRLQVVSSTRRSAKPAFAVVSVLLFGALGIAIANLILNIMTSTAVYELADLQAQKRELTTTTQIIGQEVDSLSSQQNLSNSAQKLGMIANANPVFLSIEEQKVFGKPKAALNTDGRVAKNLIANSAMTQSSTNLNATVAEAAPVAKNVANQKAATATVTSDGGAIPASPTH
jgi:cell division protein FtsB